MIYPTQIKMPRKKGSWIKERCAKFYEEWDWDKIGFATFYNRMRENPEWDMAYAIQHKIKYTYRHKRDKFVWQYAKEMEWWFYKPDPKIWKQTFYARIKIGYPKEIAILTWEAFEKAAKDKPRKKYPTRQQNYIEPIKINTSEEEYTWIDITYPKEVARVFRKEFYNVIENLEWDLRQVSEKDDMKVLNDKLELAKAELDLFNSYNH